MKNTTNILTADFSKCNLSGLELDISRKKQTLEQFTNEFHGLGKIPMFEILTQKGAEKEYITFDISINGNMLRAEHVAFSIEENESIYVAAIKREIDLDFSLDENLQELYTDCINKLIHNCYDVLS